MISRQVFNIALITLATSLALLVLVIDGRTEKILLFIIAALIYTLALILPDSFL
jgi:hypothetical protein